LTKQRIYELAKELGKDSKEVVTTAQKLGLDVKSHASSVESQDAMKIKQAYQPKQAADKPATGQQAPAQAKPERKTHKYRIADQKKEQAKAANNQQNRPAQNKPQATNAPARQERPAQASQAPRQTQAPATTSAPKTNESAPQAAQTNARPQAARSENRPQNNAGNTQNRSERPQKRAGDNNARPNNRDNQGGQRPQGQGYQGNRNNENRGQGQGYQGNRNNDNRQGGYQGNRNNENRGQGQGYQGNRNNDNRTQGQGGGYQGNRNNDNRQGGYQVATKAIVHKDKLKATATTVLQKLSQHQLNSQKQTTVAISNVISKSKTARQILHGTTAATKQAIVAKKANVANNNQKLHQKLCQHVNSTNCQMYSFIQTA